MREANEVMNRSMTREMLRGAVSAQGVDPDMFPQLADFSFVNRTGRPSISTRGMPTREVEEEDSGGGGIFGAVGDVVRTGVKAGKLVNKASTAIYRAPGVRDVAEPVFGGKIEQPWDLLRPVKRALDWEAEKIGEPAYKNSLRGITVPIYAIGEGKSLNEANRRFEYSYEHEFPDWLKEVGGGVMAPSSILGAIPVGSLAKSGYQGRVLANRIPALDSMYSAVGSSRALRTLLGLDQGYSLAGARGRAKNLLPEFKQVLWEIHANEAGMVRLPQYERRTDAILGRDLIPTVGNYKSWVTDSRPISAASSRVLRGDFDPNNADDIKAARFLNQLDLLDKPEDMQDLWRYMKVSEDNLQGFLARYTEGNIVEEPLVSTTSKSHTPDAIEGRFYENRSGIIGDYRPREFDEPRHLGTGTGLGTLEDQNNYFKATFGDSFKPDKFVELRYRKTPGIDISGYSQLPGEAEVITGGRFRVVGNREVSRRGSHVILIDLEPVLEEPQGKMASLWELPSIGGAADETPQMKKLIEDTSKLGASKPLDSNYLRMAEEQTTLKGLTETSIASSALPEDIAIWWYGHEASDRPSVVRAFSNTIARFKGKGKPEQALRYLRSQLSEKDQIVFDNLQFNQHPEDAKLLADALNGDVSRGEIVGTLMEGKRDLFKPSGKGLIPPGTSGEYIPPSKRVPTPEEEAAVDALAFGTSAAEESSTLPIKSKTGDQITALEQKLAKARKASAVKTDTLLFKSQPEERQAEIRQGIADAKRLIPELEERISFLKESLKRNPPNSISGGAPETPTMEELIRRSASLPADVWRAQSPMDIEQEMKLNGTLTKDVRNNAAKYLLPSNITKWIEARGLRLTDNAMSANIDEWKRLKFIGGNTARVVARDQIRAILNKGFKIDWEAGRVLDVEGKPYIEDLADHADLFNLTDFQKEILDLAEQPLKEIREIRKAYGIKVIPEKNRFHLQTAKKPVEATSRRTGETVQELEGIPVVTKSGLRAKQAFKYPRQYATRAEGEAAGNEYLPFLEAQQARIEQEFNTIADEWLMTALEGYFSKTPMDELKRLKPELIAAHELSGTNLANIRTLKQSITSWKKTGYSKYGWSDPFSEKAAGKLDEAVRPFYDEMVAASRIAKKADREAAIEDILHRVRMEEGKVGAQRTHLSGQRREELERLRGGTPEYPVSIRGRLFKEEEGGILQDVLYGERTPGSIEGGVIAFNDALRPMMASLDASFMGVQGLIGLFTNPKAYVQALHHAFSGEAYDAWVMAKKRSGILDSFINHEGHWASRSDPGEFLFQGRIAKLPGFRHSNTWFTRFGNSLRLHLYDSMSNFNQTDKELTELAKVAGLATGYAPGKVTNVERAALFAPRFFRSQLALLSTALGGNLSRQAQREAMKSVVGLITGGALLTYGINEALGQETDMDPNSSNFFRIRALGKDISVFGPWDTFARAMIKEAGNPGEGTKYLASAKISPGAAMFKAIWDGETRAGGDVEIDWSSPESIAQTGAMSAANLAATAAPISTQATFEEGIPSTPEEVAGAGLSFIGTKANPLSGSEKRAIARDEAAVSAYGIPWDSLEPFQKNEVLQANPNLEPGKAETETARAWESFRAIGEESNQLQLALDSQVAVGPEWIEQYKALRERMAGRYLEWEAAHPELVEQMQSREIKDPNEQARIDYVNAFKESRSPWGGLDVDKLSDRLDELESSWTSAQQAYVDRNTGFRATDQVKAYRAANRVLRPYWDTEDEVWDYVVQNRPELATYQTIDDYLLAKAEELRQLGMPEEAIGSQLQKLPLISAIQSEVSNRRLRVRFESPEIDRMLSLWYGATPLALQERFQNQTVSSSSGGGRNPRRPRRPGS